MIAPAARRTVLPPGSLWPRLLPWLALLLFGLSLHAADRIVLRQPTSRSVLDNPQAFELDVLGDSQPRRVELRLNGALVRARRKPPFHFSLNWQPEFTNTVTITATFPDGTVEKIERTFEPPRVDVTTEVKAFELWPFLSQPLGDQQPTVTYAGKRYQPQKVQAAEKTPLDLVIVLDISGSMRDLLPAVAGPLKTLIQRQQAKGHPVRLIAFDSQPRLLNLDEVLALSSLDVLYRGQAKSVVYDSLATASGLFSGSTRRTILLISDAIDDGSRHNHNSAATFMHSAGSNLVWFNATGRILGKMSRLTRQSGGFEINLSDNPWQVLQQRIEQQIHLIVPEVSFPLTLNGLDGRVWYPRRREP